MAKTKLGFKTAGILFLDVKGYSELSGPEMEEYHKKIWMKLYEIATAQYGRNDTKEYIYKNTWGDGIVLVHEDHWKLANVALKWCDYFTKKDYTNDADPTLNKVILQARIAMHYGEFRTAFDPFQNRQGYFGREIIRVARIEPITEPNHVWVTPDVKSFVEKREKEEQTNRFRFIDCGEKELAKHFDSNHIFEIIYNGSDLEKHNSSKEEVDATQPSPPPEEKEDIDPDTAIMIKSLTKKDPIAEDVTICSITREPICPVKAEGLTVISALTKHGENAGSELEVAIIVRAIEESAKKVWHAYESDTIKFVHIAALYNDIRYLFNCFGQNVRDDDIKEFLEKKSLTQQALNEAGPFVVAIKKFKEEFDKTTEWYVNEKFNLNAATDLIKDSLEDIIKTSGNFAQSLKDTGLDRIKNARDSIREAFDQFDRYALALHLKNAITTLSLKCSKLPAVWD